MFDFLSEKFSGVLGWLKDKGRLSGENVQQAMDQVKEALLEADVPYELVDEFLSSVKQEAVGQKIEAKLNPGQIFIKIVHNKLLSFLGGDTSAGAVSFQIPSIIMFIGLQGSGKTTTISKLAWWILKEAKKRNKKRKILLASVDFYRPAAVDQLEILAKKVGVDFYRAQSNNPLKAAIEIEKYFKINGYAHLFLDTSGRLHIDNEMIKELREIDGRLKPKYKILVLDAMSGQESLRVARAFEEGVGFSSAILSKMDSDARGGAAFSFRYALKKPLNFVGFGEKFEDIEPFIPERMATRILGMGDIMTLLEKAEESSDVEDQEEVSKRLMQGNFTLDDFAKQLDMLEKMGSLKRIMQYVPGMPQFSAETIEEGQKEAKRFKVIISSMTLKERFFPKILDSSRKQRIAKGSGSSAQEINKLLVKFEQGKQMAKKLKKMGKLNFFK
mgnify:CR=1 FL=1|jgi:signal recognition particle subunit SRP54